LAETILYIVDSLGLSGKTRTIAHLATHLDERYKAVICALADEATPLSGELTAGGVEVETLACSDGLDVRMVPRIARAIRTHRAAIVHCYNPRPMLYGGLAAKRGGANAAIGSLSAFACQVPDRSYGFLPEPLRTSSRRNVYRNRLSARLMRYLVTVSPGLGRRFCAYNAISEAKLRVVPYGADLDAIRRVTAGEACALRRQLGFGAADILIGSVGRLVEQKDYPTQLKAFAVSVRQAPHLRMVLAGDGPLEAALRRMTTELDIADRVTFLGHRTDVPQLLRALDIFVLASKFEPYGVALLEAKAAGLPIAATQVNEIPEIVGDGECGLLSPAGDADALSRSLTRLAQDPELRARFGERAAADAVERHGLEASVRAYHTLYESCLN